jgi:hypothetical protein
MGAIRMLSSPPVAPRLTSFPIAGDHSKGSNVLDPASQAVGVAAARTTLVGGQVSVTKKVPHPV